VVIRFDNASAPKRLFIMGGTAFSGKTTLAKELVSELGCAHISLDEINAERGMFGGEGILAQEWESGHQMHKHE
jgi:predicted kinase